MFFCFPFFLELKEFDDKIQLRIRGKMTAIRNRRRFHMKRHAAQTLHYYSITIYIYVELQLHEETDIFCQFYLIKKINKGCFFYDFSFSDNIQFSLSQSQNTNTCHESIYLVKKNHTLTTILYNNNNRYMATALKYTHLRM